MIMFPTLNKDTVHIGIGNGQWIEVDMLPLKDFDRFRAIQEKISLLPDDAPQEIKNQEINEARKEMIDMAKKVMPVEFSERIGAFDYIRLAALITVLCSGEDNSEDDDPKKKITLQSQLKNPKKK